MLAIPKSLIMIVHCPGLQKSILFTISSKVSVIFLCLKKFKCENELTLTVDLYAKKRFCGTYM